MATPDVQLHFDVFKAMSVSETAVWLDVDLKTLFSFLQASKPLLTTVNTNPALSALPTSSAASNPILDGGASALSILLPPPPSISMGGVASSLLPAAVAQSPSVNEDLLSQQLEDLELAADSPTKAGVLRIRIGVLQSHLDFFQQRLKEVEPSEELLIASMPQCAIEVKHKATYYEEVQEWAKLGSRRLSDEVVKEGAAGAVALLGPLAAALAHIEEQIQETTAALAQCTKDTDLSLSSRLEKRVVDMEKAAKAKKNDLDGALVHLQKTTWLSSSVLASRLADDRQCYSYVIAAMAEAEPGMLNRINDLVCELNNTGPLKVGELALVIDNGQFARVRVEREVDGNRYEVVFWTEVSTLAEKFEEGFDTRQRRVSSFKRRAIYADKKQKQTLPQALLKAVELPPGDISSKDAAFVMLLYAAAEKSQERLRQLCAEVEAQVPEATKIVPAGLKKMARVFAKTLDKYRGDFSCITDLARATIKCPSMKILFEVLWRVASNAAFRIVLIKNRLMTEFNADEAGGYRDMLVNLLDADSGHIVELQLTLTPLLEIKMHGSGGHVAYNVARLLGLFDKDTTEHKGALTPNVFKGIEYGLLRVLDCGGQATALAANFDSLLGALKSKSCGLVSIRLVDVGWPVGRPTSDFLDVLMGHCKHLECLSVNDKAAKGTVPPAFFDSFPKLRVVGLSGSGETESAIPPSLVNAKLLERCIMWGMKFTGNISPLLGELKNLRELVLSKNMLTGVIPFELGQLTSLTFLRLDENQLTGAIPPELGQLTNLTVLGLNQNQLSPVVPPELEELKKKKLKTLSI